MDFEKDDDREWVKDDGPDVPTFDFDDFLKDDIASLEDRLTDALDGRDYEADEFSADYIPRRGVNGDHGRHEAPGSEDVVLPERPAPKAPPRPTGRFDPRDPRYAAPERPKVVVAEPPKRVYVSPPGGGRDDRRDGFDEPPRRGMGEGMKWLIAILVAVAIIGALLVALFSGGSDDKNDPAAPSPSPSSQPHFVINTPTPTQAAADTPTPMAQATPTPEPTEPPKNSHAITVTAGSGGSVIPNGIVPVEDGANITFTVTPDSGYEISQILVDGEDIGLTREFGFNNVTKDHTVYAVFQKTATPTPAPTAEPTPTPTAEPTPTPTAPPVAAPEFGEENLN